MRHVQRIGLLFFAAYCSRLAGRFEPVRRVILTIVVHPLLAIDRAVFARFQWALFKRYDVVYPSLFYATWAIETAAVFSLFLILRRFERLRRPALILIPCITVVGPLFSPAFPGDHLVGDFYQWTTDGHLALPPVLQWVEVGVVLIWAFCYLYAKLGDRSTWSLTFPVAHFVIWGAILFGPDVQNHEAEILGYVIAPLCALLSWAVWLKKADSPAPIASVRSAVR